MVLSTSAGSTFFSCISLCNYDCGLNLIMYLILLVYLCKAPRGFFWHFCSIQAPHIIIIIIIIKHKQVP